MSEFTGWRPKGQSGVFIRFYLKGTDTYICKRGNSLVVEGGTNQDISRVHYILESHGISLTMMGLRELNNALAQSNLVASPGGYKRNFQNNRRFTVVDGGQEEYVINTKSSTDLHYEALGLDIFTAPFRQGTLNNCSIQIDSREPSPLAELFLDSKFEGSQISVCSLELGDIKFTNEKTGDVLLIERKCITDFQQSIYRNHAHDQAERYFNEVQRMQSEGKRMKVMWIIEGEKDGSRLIYNALPKIQNMDGMIAYLSAMLDQPVITSYNMNHTVYLSLKFAQCFFEQQLFYKLQTHNPLANRSGKDRLALRNNGPVAKDTDHGVTRPDNSVAAMLSYIPSIKRNVADELAKTGKSYLQIISMTADELLKIKGVGEKSAKEIYNDFNRSQ